MAGSGSNNQIFGYLGRFSLSHVFAYVLVGTVFVVLQATLPPADRVALEFFEPYRPVGLTVVGWQVIRGGLLAIVFYPFYNDFVRKERGWAVLFAAVFGLTIVGSVEPMPGSIEGVLYTKTSLLAHLVVLIASAVQVGMFTGVFFRWERRTNDGTSGNGRSVIVDRLGRHTISKYVGRSTILHVLTYFLAGVVFFELHEYETAFATMETFELYRPLDGALGVFVLPTQIIRGTMLSLLILPFYSTIFRSGRGWLYLFGLLWGLTHLGAPNAVQGSVELLVSGSLTGLFVGTTEITVQMALFAVLIWWWERRSLKRQNRDETLSATHA